MRLRQFTSFNPLLIPWNQIALPSLPPCSQSLTPFVSLWTGSLFGERVRKSQGEGKGAWEPISGKWNICLKRFSNLIDVLGNAFRRFATTRLICIHPLSRTVLLYRILLKIKPIVVRQVLDGRLIEVRTMARLSLKRQKDGSDCLIAVAAE